MAPSLLLLLTPWGRPPSMWWGWCR
jgi:hypothetical protein